MIETILLNAFGYGTEQFVNHFEALVLLGIVAMFVVAIATGIVSMFQAITE